MTSEIFKDLQEKANSLKRKHTCTCNGKHGRCLENQEVDTYNEALDDFVALLQGEPKSRTDTLPSPADLQEVRVSLMKIKLGTHGSMWVSKEAEKALAIIERMIGEGE